MDYLSEKEMLEYIKDDNYNELAEIFETDICIFEEWEDAKDLFDYTRKRAKGISKKVAKQHRLLVFAEASTAGIPAADTVCPVIVVLVSVNAPVFILSRGPVASTLLPSIVRFSMVSAEVRL